MKVLVTGSKGIVGHRLMQDLPQLGFEEVIASPSLRDFSAEGMIELLEESGVEAVIHTAAISDIGTCEKDPEGSYKANVLLPELLARECEKRKIKLAAFSSDQVYSGCRKFGPFVEADAVPANTYACHKLEMEQRVLEANPSAVLLRAEWMYDYGTPRGNFVMNLLTGTDPVKACSAQYRGVTYLKEVANVMPAVLKLPGGAYNFGSETDLNYYELTRRFLDYLGKGRIVEAISIPNPQNLWMDCSKTAGYGVVFSKALEAAIQCADDYSLRQSV